MSRHFSDPGVGRSAQDGYTGHWTGVWGGDGDIRTGVEATKRDSLEHTGRPAAPADQGSTRAGRADTMTLFLSFREHNNGNRCADTGA